MRLRPSDPTRVVFDARDALGACSRYRDSSGASTTGFDARRLSPLETDKFELSNLKWCFDTIFEHVRILGIILGLESRLGETFLDPALVYGSALWLTAFPLA